jgi:serine/threonine protein kinase
VKKEKICVFAFHPFSLPLPFADKCQGLDWHTRYKIIQGICEGSYYLYERQKEPIYHLDLNPRNILLDENMTPKLTYFGFSKIFGKDYLTDIWDRDPETLSVSWCARIIPFYKQPKSLLLFQLFVFNGMQ